MKIAVLFFGELRWYDVANNSFIKNLLPILNKHDTKYFGNFWGNPPEKLEDFNSIFNFSKISFQEQLSFYDIKKYFNNKENNFSDRLTSQLYSLYQSFLLLDNEDYDIFIKIRTDLVILKEIKELKFNNSISVCKNLYKQPLNEYATDLIAGTADFTNFKKLCSMGFSLDETLSSFNDNRDLYYHEEILAKYLVNNNISIKSHDFEIDLARHHV